MGVPPSAVARFWAPPSRESTTAPVTEIAIFKKLQLFIKFLFIWINNLKTVQRKKRNFSLKLFILPLFYRPLGRRRHSSLPPIYTYGAITQHQ
jgi:hypothetical protein